MIPLSDYQELSVIHVTLGFTTQNTVCQTNVSAKVKNTLLLTEVQPIIFTIGFVLFFFGIKWKKRFMKQDNYDNERRSKHSKL